MKSLWYGSLTNVRVVSGHQRHDFLEDGPAVLPEKLVRVLGLLFVAAVEEAKIVADVVGKLGGQLAAENLPLVGGPRTFLSFDHHGRAGVAENKMAVAIAEVEVS